MSVNEGQFSSLRRLVEDVILSFPDDSHKRIESFFTKEEPSAQDNDRVDAMDRVRKSWARAMVKSKAFSNVEKGFAPDGDREKTEKERTKARIANPVVFAEDFISDLSLGESELSSTISSCQRVLASVEKLYGANSSSTSSAQKSANSIHGEVLNSSLASVIRIGSDLHSIETHLRDSSTVLNNPLFRSATLDESVLEYKTWTRKLKFRWDSHTTHTRLQQSHQLLFFPVKLSVLRATDTIQMGSIIEGDQHSPWAIDLNQLIGIRVLSKSSSSHSRCWSSFVCFTKFCVSRRHNPFPLVLKLDREPAASSGHLTLVFEYPSCRPICQLFGPLLTTFLHRCPQILQLCK